MLSRDLQEEGWEHLIDTFILLVFSTTGNWKEKPESKSCLDLQTPEKNTSTADRIFEEAGKWKMQTVLQRIRFLQTEEDLHRVVKEEYPFQSSESCYKQVVNKIFQKFLNMSKTDFPSVHSEKQVTIFAECFEKIAQGRYLAWKLLPAGLCLTKLQATGKRFLQWNLDYNYPTIRVYN